MKVTYTYRNNSETNFNSRIATIHLDGGFRYLNKDKLAALISRKTGHKDVKVQHKQIIYYPY